MLDGSKILPRIPSLAARSHRGHYRFRGVQEETSFLGVPCLTLRENTERPITVSQGTNQLIGRDISLLKSEIRRILSGDTKKASPIPLWDGHAAERIAKVVIRGQHLL